MKRILIACLLTGFAFAASAQSAAVPVAVDAKADKTAVADADKPSDRYCLRHTGSRIVAKQNEKGQKRCVGMAGRSYTKEDLDSTGETDIAAALRKLDPAIY